MKLTEIEEIAAKIKNKYNRDVVVIFHNKPYRVENLKNCLNPQLVHDMRTIEIESLYIEKNNENEIQVFTIDGLNFESIPKCIGSMKIDIYSEGCNFSGVYDPHGVHLTGFDSGRYDGGWETIDDVVKKLKNNGNKKIIVVIEGEL